MNSTAAPRAMNESDVLQLRIVLSDRYRLLAYGVDVLSKLPNATVYIEAGASDWEPARRTARQLRAELLAADINRFLDGLPVTAYRETWPERLLRFASRNQVLLLLLGSYLFVKFAIFFWSLR